MTNKINTVLSANQLRILLHYFCTSDCYSDLHILKDSIKTLIHLNLMISSGESFEITPRGLVYVKAILKTPLPIQIWVMPDA